MTDHHLVTSEQNFHHAVIFSKNIKDLRNLDLKDSYCGLETITNTNSCSFFIKANKSIIESKILITIWHK